MMSRRAADDLGHFLERVVLPPGWQVLHEPTVASTNDLAREAARRGWPDRSVFVADYQTEGRGRHGRSWQCPPRAGLLMSALFRGHELPPQMYTMLASVAVSEAIERLLNVEPRIKWPNDIVIGGRKTAGILAEAYDDGHQRVVVVGMGINVNLAAEELEGFPNATSLAIEAGYPVHRGELLVLILERLDAWLKLSAATLGPALWATWSERLWGRSQVVRLGDGGEELVATILGADRDGALLVLTADGERRRVIAGELLP
ncbi:MAG: biotin--[acetyl-CoA-carboxylase] ligase [Chloroflexota bacterium]|nr:biotin--[acetyl-CoA-carboxylase] ligase [Chloroflexota bacterium]